MPTRTLHETPDLTISYDLTGPSMFCRSPVASVTLAGPDGEIVIVGLEAIRALAIALGGAEILASRDERPADRAEAA